MTCSARSVLFAAALVLAIASPALAGPPLLCHPYDIGTATSLPWDGTTSWSQGRAGYPLTHLVADTEAILQPGTPVVVRMETLRRAAIYAGTDPKVAQDLLRRLTARARTSSVPDALALGDAAYFVEALRQLAMLNGMAEFRDHADAIRGVIGTADGPALIQEALAARPGDAALEFEAALVTSMTDRTASMRHAEKARAGATRDVLVARNIAHLN